jgi:hypothetical protein
MKNRRLLFVHWMVACVLIVAVTGCATFPADETPGPPSIDANRVITDLTPDIEALYLAWHELDGIYKDLKFLERAYVFDPDDRQLGTIQKVALYVQDASIRTFHEWERLSVIQYIRSEMLQDYLTLCAKGLATAIDAIGYDRMFLVIYHPYIENQTVAGDVERSLVNIKAQVELMNRLSQRLLPLAKEEKIPTHL